MKKTILAPLAALALYIGYVVGFADLSGYAAFAATHGRGPMTAVAYTLSPRALMGEETSGIKPRDGTELAQVEPDDPDEIWIVQALLRIGDALTTFNYNVPTPAGFIPLAFESEDECKAFLESQPPGLTAALNGLKEVAASHPSDSDVGVLCVQLEN